MGVPDERMSGLDGLQYFVRFLLWLVLGCVYAAYMSFPAAYGELTAAQFSKVCAFARSRSTKRQETPTPTLSLCFYVCLLCCSSARQHL